MRLKVEFDREEDGRWIADIREIPGVMVYGQTKGEALRKVKILTLQVLADMLEHGELDQNIENIAFVAA